MKKNYLLILSITISLVFILLLYKIILLGNNIEEKMIEISTDDITEISKNTTIAIENILFSSDNYVQDINNNYQVSDNIEEKLEILITNNIKYPYLLHRDKKGIFRFLVDGSEDKSISGQKFDIDSTEWNDIYTLKKKFMIRHDYLQKLSITYLFPILKDDEVKLILVIDYSINKLEEINKIISLIKIGLFIILIISLTFILIFSFQIIRYRKVKSIALIDSLTNVYNKNYLEENKKDIDLNNYILGVLDIDNFKNINDTYGHNNGDIILKDLANILLKSIRKKDDFIIRFGGEEFLLLIKTNKESQEFALNVINRFFANIQNNSFILNDDTKLSITVSIGINTKPFQSANFDDAFNLADSALYTAKNSGRNKIIIHNNSRCK